MRNKKGLSLVSVLISIAITIIAILIFLELSKEQNLFQSQTTKSDSASEVLARLIFGMYYRDYYELIGVCQNKGALGGPSSSAIAGTCVNGGVLRASSSTDVKDVDLQLNILLNSEGKVTDHQPYFCIDLIHCRMLAKGHLLEVALKVSWADPADPKTLKTKIRHFRRSKW